MGTTVQKIENDEFSDDNFAAALVRLTFLFSTCILELS